MFAGTVALGAYFKEVFCVNEQQIRTWITGRTWPHAKPLFD